MSTWDDKPNDYEAAVAEIERLRAENERLRQQLGGGTMSYSLEDKLKCIRRELAMRKNVYPKWIKTGRMSPAQAHLELGVMEEIHADYALLLAVEKAKCLSSTDASKTPTSGSDSTSAPPPRQTSIKF